MIDDEEDLKEGLMKSMSQPAKQMSLSDELKKHDQELYKKSLEDEKAEEIRREQRGINHRKGFTMHPKEEDE